MTTAQQRIEQIAGRAITRAGGVLITLMPRNVSVWANIDRVNKPVQKVQSDFTVQGNVGVTVYILKQNLNDPPEEGEYIVESNNAKHTIGEVKDLGYRYQIFCQSEPG